MAKKLKIILIYIFLFLGLFFVFSGMLIPESPTEVKQVDLLQEYEIDNLTEEEIQDLESELENNSNHRESLPGENNDEIIPEYSLDEYSNETQNDLIKLVENESESIYSTELPEGKFIINIDNNIYALEGTQTQYNPIIISLFGLLCIIYFGVLFNKLHKTKTEYQTSNSDCWDDIELGDEDDEWKYVVKEDDKPKN